MSDLYKGPGNIKDYEHSLDFLNEVFFSEDADKRDFLSLLPKLYKKEYNHCANNLIVSVDGEWKGAVGLFFDEVDVLGNKLLCGGIGNVAVSTDCRGKGYMQDCMKLAMDKMIECDADFSVLGGQRQRYEYFSFEPAGYVNNFRFNKQNLKHIYGKNYSKKLIAVKVNEEDDVNINFIQKLYYSSCDKLLRPDDKFYDYLISWCQNPYVFYKDNVPIAYCIFNYDKSAVTELKIINSESLEQLIPEIFLLSDKEEINITIPAYEKEYVNIISKIAESQSVDHCASLTVLNWKRFVKAYFELKASYANLCDGKQSFLIHGYKKDESFTVTIKNANVNIDDEIENPIELSQKEALALFFSLFSIKKDELPSNTASWFPLHWFIRSSDKV